MAIDIERVLDAVVANVDADDKFPEDDDEKADAIAALRLSLSRYVLGPLIEEIVNNAEISVTVSTTTSGEMTSGLTDWLPADGMQDGTIMPGNVVEGTGSGSGTGTIS